MLRRSVDYPKGQIGENKTVVPPKVNFDSFKLPATTALPALCLCDCRRSCGLKLRIPIVPEMGPRGRLVVHASLPTKEVVVDMVEFDVAPSTLFENKVGLLV